MSDGTYDVFTLAAASAGAAGTLSAMAAAIVGWRLASTHPSYRSSEDPAEDPRLRHYYAGACVFFLGISMVSFAASFGWMGFVARETWALGRTIGNLMIVAAGLWVSHTITRHIWGVGLPVILLSSSLATGLLFAYLEVYH